MKKGLLLLLLWAAPILAADPVVENVRVSQRNDGSRLADIYYDVSDADGDTLAVSVQASDDDGASWIYPVRTLSGDVGPGVTPGSDRHIVWDLAADGVELSGHALRVRVIASDHGVLHPPRSPYPVSVFMHSGEEDWLDPAVIERAARADLIVLQAYQVWGEERFEQAPSFTAALRAQNPDIKIIGYVSAFESRWGWEDQDPNSFAYRWLEATRPYWCWTTAGDTVSCWPGAVALNILDPACRQTMIDLIVEFQRTTNNPVDGVHWDYFNRDGLWIPDFLDVVGEPDMDQDGVPQAEDPDEKQAYNEACVALVTALRDSLGDGFIQIFNGQRAFRDSAFAALGDGIHYELFPTLGFPGNNMEQALDPEYPTSLFHVVDWPRTTAGGPYILVENVNSAQYVDTEGVPTTLDYSDLFRVAALLVDHVYPAWGSHAEGWPRNDFSLGPPLGPPVIEGNLYRRDFRYGRLEMEMTTGKMPNPFHYTVWVNGKVVERLAVPYHYP